MKKKDACEKQPEVKNELLKTYFTSLLCMVLCVTMFLGTSYAWFTSEVNNTNNEIYIGILDLELMKQQKDSSWVSLSEKTGDVSTTNLFNKEIRWEPGYTALETVKVINKGDMAFNYTLAFTDGKVTDRTQQALQDEKWKEVAKHFDVWVYAYHDNSDAAPVAASYEDITKDGSGWVPAGSLAELLAGKSVLEGSMVTVRKEGLAPEEANPGTTDGVPTEHTYTIALHMKEDADASVVGHKISLNVKLVAYQMSKEEDAFGNKYDQLVTNAKGLQDAFAQGGDIVLATDIDLSQTQVEIPEGVTATLDLNGHNITGKTDKQISLITNQGDLTIRGQGQISMSFDGAVDNGKAVNAISNRGKLTVNSGTISNTGVGDQIGYAIDNYNGASLIVNGGTITASGSSYYDAIRLFCGSEETRVTVNGGQISSIWAQNPSDNKATEVKGTVILEGGTVTTTYYENYTTVLVADGVTATVTAYGAGSDNVATRDLEGYTEYYFVHQ